MGIFSAINDKIFRGRRRAAPEAPRPASAPATSATSAPATPPPAAVAREPVDVEAVLTEMAAEKGGGGNWRTSIVDLLKLLDLDSGLEARKELAADLGVQAGPHGSAEQNLALSKAVWAALAKNGGKVPASLRD